MSLATLRTLLCQEPSKQLWRDILECFKTWKKQEELELGIDYAKLHLTKWPFGLRYLPERWVTNEQLCIPKAVELCDLMRGFDFDEHPTIDAVSAFFSHPTYSYLSPIARIYGITETICTANELDEHIITTKHLHKQTQDETIEESMLHWFQWQSKTQKKSLHQPDTNHKFEVLWQRKLENIDDFIEEFRYQAGFFHPEKSHQRLSFLRYFDMLQEKEMVYFLELLLDECLLLLDSKQKFGLFCYGKHHSKFEHGTTWTNEFIAFEGTNCWITFELSLNFY